MGLEEMREIQGLFFFPKGGDEAETAVRRQEISRPWWDTWESQKRK